MLYILAESNHDGLQSIYGVYSVLEWAQHNRIKMTNLHYPGWLEKYKERAAWKTPPRNLSLYDRRDTYELYAIRGDEPVAEDISDWGKYDTSELKRIPPPDFEAFERGKV